MAFPSFDELTELRRIGVKKVSFKWPDISEVEFFALGEVEPAVVAPLEKEEKPVKVNRVDLDDSFITDPFEFESQVLKKENE